MSEMPERIQEVLREWDLPKTQELYLTSGDEVGAMMQRLEGLPGRPAEVDRCKYCLLKSLLFGLESVYYSQPIRFFFERNPNGLIRAVIWDFDEGSLFFTGCKAESDTLPLYDVIQVTRSDTMMVAERNFFDLIFVSQSRADTLFVEPKALSEGRATWPTAPGR